MYKNKKIVGLVPARGGSKGIPGKNIKRLAGKPLIAWTIEAAKKSKYLDGLIVSTDDKKIASISERLGAEVPFVRPKDLATDYAKGIDVVLHAVEWIERNHRGCDMMMQLQPTSPLRSSEDIDGAIKQLCEMEHRSVVSVCEAEHHPFLSNMLPPDGSMKDFIKAEHMTGNRQDFPDYYRINGAIYLAYIDFLKEKRSFFGEGCFAYLMPCDRSVDIDSKMDFSIAEALLNGD